MFPFPVAPIASSDVFGQWERTTAGATTFVVPAGVYAISAVVIGGGSCGRSVDPFDGGAGGGLHWRNDVPVTPGETLDVVVGRGGIYGGANFTGLDSYIARSATDLLRGGGGGLTTTVGLTYAGTLGGGGGNGGGGGSGGGAANGGLGGGAGGYGGNGGPGERYAESFGTGYNLPAGGPSSGAGRGGSTPGGPNDVPGGWQSRNGEGVGLYGLTGAYGSPIGTQRGNGSFAFDAPPGGVRIIWGGGRSYPSNAGDL